MNADQYLKKISARVHWKFSRRDADEIVDDYKALLTDAEARKDDFISALGTPSQAASHLEAPSGYRLWLAAFILMLSCAALLFLEMYSFSQNTHWNTLLLVLGLAVPIIWFWRTEKGYRYHAPLSPAIPALLLLMAAAVCLECLLFRSVSRSLSRQTAKLLHLILKSAGNFSLFAAAAGIILAKLRDRRWRAVYAAALTTLAVSVFLFSILRSMSLDTSSASWWIPYLRECVLIALTGTLATLLSLC